MVKFRLIRALGLHERALIHAVRGRHRAGVPSGKHDKTGAKPGFFAITAVFSLFSIIGLSLIKSQRRRFSHDFSTQPDS